jgi:uncharacterized protein
MTPRLSLITLGVADMARARAFYEALGFTASSQSQPSVTFFQAGGIILGLYGRAELAADANVTDSASGGFSGVALAQNVGSDAEVDALIAHAVACGGRLVKAAHKVSWGGYSGYFADPDGHLWEVAHNPFWPLDANGTVRLPM